MIEYIITSALGLMLHWALELSRAWRSSLKSQMPFYWSKFASENIVNFIVCVISSAIMFFIIDINILKTMTFPYVTFIRMDTFVFLSGGMMGSYIVNQLLKMVEYIFKFKRDQNK